MIAMTSQSTHDVGKSVSGLLRFILFILPARQCRRAYQRHSAPNGCRSPRLATGQFFSNSARKRKNVCPVFDRKSNALLGGRKASIGQGLETTSKEPASNDSTCNDQSQSIATTDTRPSGVAPAASQFNSFNQHVADGVSKLAPTRSQSTTCGFNS